MHDHVLKRTYGQFAKVLAEKYVAFDTINHLLFATRF